jgi:hypothetical protein
VFIAIGNEDLSALGVAPVGIAVVVVLANLLIRLAISSQTDRAPASVAPSTHAPVFPSGRRP